MNAYLLDREGKMEPHLDRVSLEARLSSGEFFWLDLESPGDDDFAILRDVFKFHPLAIEDSQHFGQRAKVEDYGDFVFIVFFGAAPSPDEDRLVELHCFYSDRFLVTVRRDESPACNALRDRYVQRPAPAPRPVVLLYRLLDSLTDSFFSTLEDFDARIDDLQDQMLRGPSDEQLNESLEIRRGLIRLKRAVSPQRDLMAGISTGLVRLPDMDEDAERYFRDVHDHLIRVSDMIDSYRELLASGMDVYLTMVSNRLNLVMKRLTLIATIALPLIVITGFFGQNFGAMVRNIDSWPAFLGFGVGLPLLAVGLLLAHLRRRDVF